MFEGLDKDKSGLIDANEYTQVQTKIEKENKYFTRYAKYSCKSR